MTVTLNQEDVTARYAAGESCEKIAAVYGCYRTVVSDALRAWGVAPAARNTRCSGPKPRGFADFSVEQNATLAAEYRGGATMQALARKYNVGVATVKKHLGRLGVESRPVGPPIETRGDEIRCSVCREWKHETEYARHHTNSTGRFGSCKACEMQKYRNRMYKLDDVSYRALLAVQGGLCAICREAPGSERNDGCASLSVDHCHDSLKNRGLLCGKCNRTLGLMGDNPDFLRAAADYIELHRGKEVPAGRVG